MRANWLFAWVFVLLACVVGVVSRADAQGYIFNQMGGSHNTLGTGNGSLFFSSAIAQGDFNGDGRMDFAVAVESLPNCGLGPQTECSQIQIYLAQSDGSYAPSISYNVPGDGGYNGGANCTIAVGDVNGDGKLDLVYTAQFNPGAGYPNYVVVQLGNGDGTFQSPIMSVTPALSPQGVILGDFNGDGKLDLALADAGAQNIYVHLGNGDGTFQPGIPYSVGGGAAQVITADFNNDGKLDLAVACLYGGGIGTYVLLGNGDGTFGAATYYAVGGYNVAAAEMNGDGILDLIVSGGNGAPATAEGVWVLPGNGDGTFASPIFTAVPGNFGGNIVTADFNGDGIMDVALPAAWTGIVVLLGNNDGTFKSPQFAYGNTQGEWPGALIAGDYNLDRKIDLASVGYVGTGQPFSILTNNGDGTFGAGGDLTGVNMPQGVVTGDFNGDGLLDLAVTDANGLEVYLGEGNGTFQAPQTYSLGSVGGGNLVTADFNHDGNLDLAVVNPGSGTVSILLGVGDGTFLAPVNYQTGSSPYAIAVGDFNKDGKLDLAVTDSGDSDIAVLLGNGDGTFQPAIFSSTGAGTSGNDTIAVADFNGDGNPDIAVGSLNAPSCYGAVELLFGNGDGTFQSPANLSLPNGDSLTSIAAASLRNNGITDLIVSTSSNNITGNGAFLVYLGNGNGTFSAPIANYTGVGRSIVLGDFNGDGKLDIAFGGLNSAVGVVLGNGDGTFQPELQYETPHTASNIYVTSLAAGDFNGDGTPDLAVTSGPSGFVTIFLSNPVAAFSTASLNFGTVNVGASSETMNLSVTNQSPTTLVISGISITGANAGDFTETNDCDGSLAGGAGCSVSVTFSPTNSGIRIAAVTVTSSSLASPQSVPLTGTGTAPAASVSPGTLTFSSQLQGTSSAPQPVMLSNTGTAPLTISNIATNADFSQTNNCGASVPSSSSCTISVTFTPTAAGTRTGTLTITDNGNGVGGSTQTVSLTGTGTGAATTTGITAPGIAYGGTASVTVSVTSAQGTVTGNVSLTVDNGSPLTQPLSGGSTVFSISGLAGGSHSLSASYAAQGSFAASSATGTLQVNKAQPTVTFTGAPASAAYNSSFTVSATTNASTTAVITASGACSISGATVTISAPSGTCWLSATWAADNNYLAASATQSTIATKATPTINWTIPAAITYGVALSGTQLNATATYNGAPVAGTFVYTPAKGTVLTAGAQTLSVTFTPTKTADYNTATASVTLQVNPATPKIAWAKPAAITYGTALSSTQLDATANVAGTFTYTPAAGTVLGGGTQTLSVLFTPADTTDYTTATHSVTVTVNKATSTTVINSSTPNPSLLGQAVMVNYTVTGTGVPTGTVTVKASTGQSCNGTLSAGTGSCSLTFTASGSPTLTASYAGDGNFKSSTSAGVTQQVTNFTVSAKPATQSITPGSSATYTMTLTPVNGFTGAVGLSCNGEPSGPACTISPNSLTLSGSALTATATVQTTTSTTAGTYTLTFTGTFGSGTAGLTHTTTVTLTVD